MYQADARDFGREMGPSWRWIRGPLQRVVRERTSHAAKSIAIPLRPILTKSPRVAFLLGILQSSS